MARGSKNVLDCRLSGIKLVAAFLYCGYRNQTKSSPDKMSMTSPPQTKPRLSTILSAGHFFKVMQTCLFLFLRLAEAAQTRTDQLLSWRVGVDLPFMCHICTLSVNHVSKCTSHLPDHPCSCKVPAYFQL